MKIDARAQQAIGAALGNRGVSDGCSVCGHYHVTRGNDVRGMTILGGVVASADMDLPCVAGNMARFALEQLAAQGWLVQGRGVLDEIGAITLLGGKPMPAAVLVCGHCGHTTQHSMAELGLKVEAAPSRVPVEIPGLHGE